MVVTVRPARADEVDAAIQIWKAANAGGQLPHHAQHLRSWATRAGAVLFVADDNARLVGMALSLVGRADDGAGEPIPGLRHVTGVAVHPEWQGAGIGGKLLDAVLVHARGTAGCDRVTLWSHRTNTRAYRLFTTRGFRPTGRTTRDEVGAAMIHLEASLVGHPDNASTSP